MRLVTYRKGDAAARLGAEVGDLIVDIQKLGAAHGTALPSTMLEFIDDSATALPLACEFLQLSPAGWPLGSAVPASDVAILAPIPRPRKNIFGIGLNYVEHVNESTGALDTPREIPKQPVIFSKPPTAVIGPGQAIEHNGAITQQLDWEVELAVIIGRTAKRIRLEDALNHVFGYAVMIDISARDNRRAGQWIYSKGMDTYAPFGPRIVTADEVPDPQMLDLSLAVNGVEKQNSNTRHMIFSVAALIADISQGITLEPGDIIATGTPSGVGAGRTPQEWLWPGDVVTAQVQHIGQIRHPVVPV